MAKPDALFLLIKSLTPSEKALVRQVDKGQAGYLALFDMMSRQREYDERKAKRKLQQLGHDVNFAYAKNYLTKHILRVLRENDELGQHASTRQVQEIELLMRRRIFDLAEKMLVKAREKAFAEERWHEFLQLSNVEMACLLQTGGPLAESLLQIESLNEKRRRVRDLLMNLGEFEDLHHRYHPVLKRKQNARNEWDLALVKEFASHPLLSAPDQAKSVRARRIYYMCQTMIQTYLGQYHAAHDALIGNLDLYKAHGFLRDDFPEGYLNELWRLGGHQLYTGDYGNVEKTLAEINLEREGRGLSNADIFEKYNLLLLSYALTAKRYDLVTPELAKIREGILSYGDTLAWSTQSLLVLLLARFYFEQGQWSDAKVWLNYILDHPERGNREDISSLARIMLIFIYFENGDGDLTEATSRSTRKYLQRRDALYQFERRILRFLEQHSFSEQDGSFQHALCQLHSDLLEIFKDPLEANILAIFDIMGWLAGKIKD